MQLNTARRPNKTYGKGSKSSLVHDLFSYRSNYDDSSATASSAASPAPLADAQIDSMSHDLAERPDSLSPEPSSHPSKPNVSDKTKPKRQLLQDISVYDMPPSDDGNSSDTSGSRASKRRRVIGLGNSARPFIQEVVHPISKPANKTRDVQWEAKQIQDNHRRAHSTNRSLKKSSSSQKMKSSDSKKPATSQVKSTKTAIIGKPMPAQRIKRSERSPLHGSEGAHMADHSGTDASENPSEHSHRSATLSKITPKKKRSSPGGTESDLSSPGNIGLTGLKLSTPGMSPLGMSPEPDSDASTKQKRSRRRLIDRLDAPINGIAATSEQQLPDAPTRSTPPTVKKSSKHRGKSAQQDRKGNQSKNESAYPESLPDSQARINLTTKPRMTYASQRSHLSDMVSDLDGYDNPSSQKSADEFLLQITASNTASQLELDDESDDPVGVGKLKSIHELRQAGINNRFERELDALFEDIVAGKNASKALRLQALVKLVSRLRDSNFASHLAAGSRIGRLTNISNQQVDLPTGILLMITYSALSETETISSDVLGQLFKAATDLAPTMLTDASPLVKIVKDRKQNLSRALIRDVLEFVENSGAQDQSPNVATQFCSDWSAITCLERILRKLLQLGNTSARLSTSVYATILRSFSSQVHHLGDQDDGPLGLSKLETTLSLLELCSFCIDDADLHIADIEYVTLGNSLADVVYQSACLSESLEGSVLRVVVSLSNNRPRMCRLLGDTTISKATFGIIDKNFLKLAHQADNAEALDEQKLDSVVLALGCLLNFAECDPNLRTRLSAGNRGDEDYIAQLVTIFNSQVTKVDEAMTTEQSQVSVAFGYLAMLLCTLSLHPAIKSQVTQRLHNKSFDELCGAAERFFSHLRTLEHISEDDAAMSTFTARFSAILETVRAL